ncbi:PAP2 superfamily protein [Anaerohalosphaera lusitana]|uniref:PAP2 superfamily protein n=1 Tax=Anaerohalosphaera lusitana TaxID=1936003 RepID=A0A1U9NQL6_9BACT|nr:phosphatase PAP2 family protein [Anaerohalosphaera lusitana]AQT70221.1 PAP2 superfamily protein [Anaerohalosphaera lusitana]
MKHCIALLIVILVTATPVFAGTQENTQSGSLLDEDYQASFDEVKPLDALWDDIWTLPDVIEENTVEILDNPDYVNALLMAGGASIAMHASGADDDIADNFEDHQALRDDWADEGTYLVGGPGFHFAATGLWYLFSHANQDEINKKNAWTMMKALSVTGFWTLTAKVIRNNDTPNGKDLAWPSGHTSSSFTVAAVLDELYGPNVGIPAYLGAGFVGFRMMDSGDHWGSDVVFGAVLGYIVGHHVAGEDKLPQVGGFDVIPFSGVDGKEEYMGIGLHRRF